MHQLVERQPNWTCHLHGFRESVTRGVRDEQELPSTQRIQTPVAILFSFDQISFKKPEYKPLFYSVLRNTLYCPTIDLATSLAYSDARHRCVTRDGVVIESSGAMSGSGKMKKGGMGSFLHKSDECTLFKKAMILDHERSL
jgi:chromosome segregation ATPase